MSLVFIKVPLLMCLTLSSVGVVADSDVENLTDGQSKVLWLEQEEVTEVDADASEVALTLENSGPEEKPVVENNGSNEKKEQSPRKIVHPEIRRLLAEKQRKIADLEKCSKHVKGLKIAGISTIGLTAVGVAGNIVLASKKKNVSEELIEKASHASPLNRFDVSEDAADYMYIDLNKQAYTSECKEGCCVSGAGEWCVMFEDYTVKGTSACTENTGDEEYAVARNQNITAGDYSDEETEWHKGKYVCYCKMTSWKPNDGDTRNASSLWVLADERFSGSACSGGCAWGCSEAVSDEEGFRQVLFGSVK